MTLSIIIVNFNVKYFLEQCLYSVLKSSKGLAVELIVVDNNSSDGSLDYLKPRFPEATFISNNTNVGFAKACNQGVSQSTGSYILFLNPDTLIGEDSLSRCIEFLDCHPDGGAVGVKMIDGAGRYLKESKRAFPSPATSLFKLFGFAALFPRSALFSKYYLGHLDSNLNHEVDVLAGAFMMVRRPLLEQVKGFDESFFMYGEDIDLSYRLQKTGFRNYYFAEATIIHFKGESTKRGSLNFVRLFYAAMSIFVNKHYGGSGATFFNLMLHGAIWTRAVLAALAKFIKWIGLPFIDGTLILLALWIVKEFWQAFIKEGVVYPSGLVYTALPVYTIVYLVVAYYAGLYNKWYRWAELARAMLIALVVLLAGYALLPESLRFSRGIITLGAILGLVLVSAFRWLLIQANILQKAVVPSSKPYLLIAATEKEFQTVSQFLETKYLSDKLIGRVAVDGVATNSVTVIHNVATLAPALAAKELIFCVGQLSYKKIIELIASTIMPLRLRFHAANSCSSVGSDVQTDNGDVITSEAFNIEKQHYRRLKRLIDVASSLALLILLPVVLITTKGAVAVLWNAVDVLVGKKTWVGYIDSEKNLPNLRCSVLGPNGAKQKLHELTEASVKSVDYWYAKSYRPLYDVRVIVKNYRHLSGRVLA